MSFCRSCQFSRYHDNPFVRRTALRPPGSWMQARGKKQKKMLPTIGRSHEPLDNPSPRAYNICFFGSDHFSWTCFREIWRQTDICKTLVAMTKQMYLTKDGSKQRQTRVYLHEQVVRNHFQSFTTPPQSLKDWEMPRKPGVKYDLAVVVSYGLRIPERILASFKYGAINLHPSLLPKYRGAAPIQHAILNGDSKIGISIQELSPLSLDSGQILRQIEVDLPPDATYASQEIELSAVGAELLVDTIRNLDKFRQSAWPQDDTQATVAPKLSRADSEIRWDEHDATRVWRMYRALSRTYPIWFYLDEVRFATIAEIFPSRSEAALPKDAPPGTALLVSRGLDPDSDQELKRMAVKCKVGWIEADYITVAGKKPCQAYDFFNGYAQNQTSIRFPRQGLNPGATSEPN